MVLIFVELMLLSFYIGSVIEKFRFTCVLGKKMKIESTVSWLYISFANLLGLKTKHLR